MTYEGARSIAGPFLAVLGTSATGVGIVSGFGEFIGYALRLVSGFIVDKTGKYWLLTISGYAINVLAVPLLALTHHWEIAALLIVMERAGKALRAPARDVMLSYATHQVGRGKGFGLHQALDQVGAVLGPLIVASVLYFQNSYQLSFAILLFPALLTMLTVYIAYKLYPTPHNLEPATPNAAVKNISKKFRIYVAAGSLVAAGYADFPLIAYHFEKMKMISDMWIAILYTIAMLTDALASLLLGYLYDKNGLKSLLFVIALTAFFAPLVFLGGFYSVMVGVILWGIGLGAQSSIMKAAIVNLVPMERRGIAYGTFNMFFGVTWFLGSAVMGILYDTSITLLIAFSLFLQLLSIPFFFKVIRS